MVVAAEEVQPRLDQAALTAPGDDRVWLARAYLAERYGHYAEARQWLDASLRKHPTDPVVWRADLQWALAADEPQEALRALARIPADRVRSPERLFLRAWFAAHRNDPNGERDRPRATHRGRSRQHPALDRLATLALQAGQLDRAAAFRRRQEETHRDKELYRRLLLEDRAPIPPDELHDRARLAERLGRWFEARGWLTLALEHDPGDRLARDAPGPTRPRRIARPTLPPLRSLLELVGESARRRRPSRGRNGAEPPV